MKSFDGTPRFCLPGTPDAPHGSMRAEPTGGVSVRTAEGWTLLEQPRPRVPSPEAVLAERLYCAYNRDAMPGTTPWAHLPVNAGARARWEAVAREAATAVVPREPVPYAACVEARERVADRFYAPTGREVTLPSREAREVPPRVGDQWGDLDDNQRSALPVGAVIKEEGCITVVIWTRLPFGWSTVAVDTSATELHSVGSDEPTKTSVVAYLPREEASR